ncbi:hypothetical protein [Marinilactibacillus psychrotolerans]|uniref:hypothetical protein n=1 Tax=Marinilactibacillus psychrotolerans TaxID=191770 RepID=UPI001D00A069|nr:hypothetical protein [Marinilactibacillus psychrotolerans]
MDKDYLISKDKYEKFQNIIKIKDLYIHYNNCNVFYTSEDKSSVVLIGDVIDCRDPNKTPENILNEIIELNSLEKLLEYAKYLLGRYVLLNYKNSGKIEVLPDANCTVPINYYKDDKTFVVSSSTFIISDIFDLPISKESLKIKSKADNQHPLPYNKTMFDDIKVIIPNHYLKLDSMEMIRFYPNQNIKENSFDFVLNETIKIMDKVIAKVAKDHKLSIPITAGIDSRTILALFKDHSGRIPLYTFYNKGEMDSWDIKVPKTIATKFGLTHYTFERVPISSKKVDKLKVLLGYQENERILENAYTLSQSELSEHSFLSGDIIPIVKSNFGKNLPENFATLSYFITKTHNYSRENKYYISEWMRDVENHYNVSKFDLFFWEYRTGRWFPKNADNYDVFSDPFYLFNCRYLIELWISISREDRMNKSFHKEIIKSKWPELLEISVNPGKKTQETLFSNQYAYYLGSFLKYQIKRFK